MSAIDEIKLRLGSVQEILEDNGVKVCFRKFSCIYPDHPDKHPSASIYADGERWHCFGCNRGGDALDAWAILNGCGLADAVGRLARLFDISDVTHSSREWKPKTEIERLVDDMPATARALGVER